MVLSITIHCVKNQKKRFELDLLWSLINVTWTLSKTGSKFSAVKKNAQLQILLNSAQWTDRHQAAQSTFSNKSCKHKTVRTTSGLGFCGCDGRCRKELLILQQASGDYTFTLPGLFNYTLH